MGKIPNFLEFTILENAMIRCILSHVPSQSKLAPKFLSSWFRQQEITHSPKQHSFENLFPSTAESGGGNYDLLYQNLIRKCEDDLEH